jgi:hypothetical protein
MMRLSKNFIKIEGANPNALDKLLGKMTYFLPLLTGANRAQQIYNGKDGRCAYEQARTLSANRQHHRQNKGGKLQRAVNRRFYGFIRPRDSTG